MIIIWYLRCLRGNDMKIHFEWLAREGVQEYEISCRKKGEEEFVVTKFIILQK